MFDDRRQGGELEHVDVIKSTDQLTGVTRAARAHRDGVFQAETSPS